MTRAAEKRVSTFPWGTDEPIRIGVSSCLLGNLVRYDGGHKRNQFLTETLSPFVRWVPVCPEVELGLGVPRETVRLEEGANGMRLVAPRSGTDHTAAMRRYAHARVADLAREDLCGYVLKKNSPSCGMERVKVYGSAGPPKPRGRGLFAEVLLEALPHLPVEEEGRLNDPRLRENFIERVFAYRRLRTLFKHRWALADLIAFHTAHKLQLLAHSPSRYQTLGRLVAGAKSLPRPVLRSRYAAAFMLALASPATTARHVNVLHHIVGHLRSRLDDASRLELLEVIRGYRAGHVPLVVPLTLIRHHVRHLGIAYLQGQIYLDPHPRELMLRNHV